MKKILLLFITTLGLYNTSVAQTSFGSVESEGFDGMNGSVKNLQVFKGKLYAGMGNGNAQIYRSAIGDAGSFAKVYDGNFDYESADHLTVSNEGSGYLFAFVRGGSGPQMRMPSGATTITGGGGGFNSKVIRSVDGVTWEDYFELPSGIQPLRVTSISMFKGTGTVDSVYISFTDGTGQGQVVRNAVDANDFINSSTWQNVCNFNVLFGTPGRVNASAVYNGKLYYVTEDNRMYETGDGTTFTENTAFYNGMGGGSMAGNNAAKSLVVHNSELYIGTSASSGGQLWKTADGVVFDSLYAHTFENTRRLTSAGGKVWMIATTFEDFNIISYDGIAGTVEVSDEFGNNTELEAENNSSIIEFASHLYIGVEHYAGGGKRIANNGHNQILEMGSNGGQIWRTCLTGPLPIIGFSGAGDTTVCAGSSVTITATAGHPSYMWSNGNTSQFLSTNAAGEYSVSVVDVNGCRNSASYSIYNFTPVPAFFTDSAGGPALTGITVCKGDTSNTLRVHPENDSYALKVTGQDQGMVTPASAAFAGRQITIELWMNPSTNNNGQVMTEYDTAGTWATDNYDLIEYYSNTIYVEMPGIGEFQLDGPVSANQWTHVVLRYDGTTLQGFLNGVLSSGSSSGSWGLPDAGVDAFKIGYGFQSGIGTAASFLGNIKDVRIWNSVRSDLDIANNMYALTPGTYPDLIYHYMMNEGTGTVANDISGNNNNSVSVSGTFVSPEVVTVTPSTGLINVSGNYYSFHPLQTTTYTSTYTNSLGCIVDSSNFTVTVPKINFSGSIPAICGTADAQLVVSPAGSYTWTPSVVDNGGYFSPDPQPTVATYYTVQSFTTDGNCNLIDSILVNVGPEFISNTIPPIMIYGCEESNVTLDVMASGGTAPWTFYWQEGGQTISDTTYEDSLSIYLPPGNTIIKTATGIDAIGCPLVNPPTFTVTPTGSTDLHGHVTTPPPSSLNVDNGFVYVFKHQPGSAVYDTVGYTNLDANGDYLFTPLVAGDYLIKVMPDETDFPTAVPTYYGNAFQWDSSIVYTHGCSQVDTADIQVMVSSPDTGSASISGYILEGLAFNDTTSRLGPGAHDQVFAPGGPLKGIDVKLGKNPGGGIQARTMSDSTGYYEFDSIPVGGYKIYVDIPNLPMDSTRELIVVAGDSSVQNNYFADSASIYINPDTVNAVGIYSTAKLYENKFSIYPNPAKDVLYVSYELEKEGKVAFEITNVFGQVVKYEQPRKHPSGKNIFIFNIDQLNLQGGVYFISILNENKKFTQRIVVVE